METNIYILKLKNNKYYVGKTQDPAKRFFEHLSGSGSTWTQLHEPIEIINILPNEDNFEENNQVKKLMLIHGIDNVRGGSYSQIELSVEQKNTLQTELRSAQDLCINCGSNKHFIKDCPVKINNYKQNNNNNKQNSCFRCGRQSHMANDCYATIHINGYELSEDDDSDDDIIVCYKCGRQNHYASQCYAKYYKKN